MITAQATNLQVGSAPKAADIEVYLQTGIGIVHENLGIALGLLGCCINVSNLRPMVQAAARCLFYKGVNYRPVGQFDPAQPGTDDRAILTVVGNSQHNRSSLPEPFSDSGEQASILLCIPLLIPNTPDPSKIYLLPNSLAHFRTEAFTINGPSKSLTPTLIISGSLPRNSPLAT